VGHLKVLLVGFLLRFGQIKLHSFTRVLRITLYGLKISEV
jgi:hypothetical protein